jgi:hypothetical protein
VGGLVVDRLTGSCFLVLIIDDEGGGAEGMKGEEKERLVENLVVCRYIANQVDE